MAKDLEEKFDDFVEVYEEDMRGDNKPESENIGMVNHIREIKKVQEDYPSLTYIWAHDTRRIVVIFGVMVILIIFLAGSELVPTLGSLLAAILIP